MSRTILWHYTTTTQKIPCARIHNTVSVSNNSELVDEFSRGMFFLLLKHTSFKELAETVQTAQVRKVSLRSEVQFLDVASPCWFTNADYRKVDISSGEFLSSRAIPDLHTFHIQVQARSASLPLAVHSQLRTIRLPPLRGTRDHRPSFNRSR